MSGVAVGSAAHEVPQRCPGAAVLPFDLPHYRQIYDALVEALEDVSPVVEAQPVEAAYLDLTSLPDLSPDDPEAVLTAVKEIVRAPYSPRVGIATGKFTAWIAAHTATAVRPIRVTEAEKAVFLERAPSTLLPADRDTAMQLHLMGLRTLGAIARLPRSAMTARFGWPGERLHRLASGDDREPLTPYRPEPVLRETWTFGTPPTTSLFFLALEKLLRRAWSRTERGERGVRQVLLRVTLENGDLWEKKLTLRRATERWENALDELKRRLESLLPEGPLAELSIELTAFASRVDGQLLLIEKASEKRLERLHHELSQRRERRRLHGRPANFRIVEVDPWSFLPEERYGLISYDY